MLMIAVMRIYNYTVVVGIGCKYAAQCH